jgi:K+-transporting ATPase KdpF subunit
VSPGLVFAAIEPDHVIGLAVAVVLFVYLVVVLLEPERF